MALGVILGLMVEELRLISGVYGGHVLELNRWGDRVEDCNSYSCAVCFIVALRIVLFIKVREAVIGALRGTPGLDGIRIALINIYRVVMPPV